MTKKQKLQCFHDKIMKVTPIGDTREVFLEKLNARINEFNEHYPELEPISITKIERASAHLSDGRFIWIPVEPFTGKVTVRSRDLIVGELFIEQVNVKEVTETGFKTERFEYLLI